jgi:hypothetical protein
MMNTGVSGAFVMLAIVTNHYEEAEFCRRECELAAQKCVPIIPIILSTTFTPAHSFWLNVVIPAGNRQYAPILVYSLFINILFLQLPPPTGGLTFQYHIRATVFSYYKFPQ